MSAYLFTFLVVVFSWTVSAQPPTAVNNYSYNEVHHFAGLIDDMHHIRMSLQCINSECKGELSYTESGTQFKLEGLKQGNTLLLEEIDQQEAVSGLIKADWDNENLVGEWTNLEGDIGSSIYLQKLDNKNALARLKNDKWVKIYRGIILWDEVEMILHHLGHQQISGSIYYSTLDEEKPISGIIREDGNLELSIENAARMKEANLTTKNGSEDSFRAEYVDQAGQKHFSSFELKKKIPVGYTEYADYVVSYEILFPDYANTSFKQWTKTHLKTWVNRCREQVKAVKDNYPVNKPEARATERAYIWFDVEQIHNDLLVGHFYFSNTWNSQTVSKSINFDLKSGKEIVWNDLFKKKKRIDSFIEKFIADNLRRNPRYMDRGFREWVKEESFPLFTIQKNGLQLSTQYDEIHGQAYITIPYEQLKPYLKKKTMINKFF